MVLIDSRRIAFENRTPQQVAEDEERQRQILEAERARQNDPTTIAAKQAAHRAAIGALPPGSLRKKQCTLKHYIVLQVAVSVLAKLCALALMKPENAHAPHIDK